MRPTLNALQADRATRHDAFPLLQPMTECQRIRDALRWCWSESSCAPGIILLKAALDELPPGSDITPPGLEDYHRLRRLLRAMPWARRGFIPLARLSDEWGTAAELLCNQIGLPLPEPGEPI